MKKLEEVLFSVIIPILDEEKYIAHCLDSIIESDFDKDQMEVLLVDGGSKDKTIEIIQKYIQKHPFISLLDNPKRIVPIAMNIGIKNAKGDYIIRLDAHASYPKDYFSKLIHYHEILDADNIGGVIQTEVKNKTDISNAIRNVLSDKLGVGSSFRSGIDEIKEVDTVPFGCFKKEVFDKVGVYDERLVRNQDIELNKRIKSFGGKIYIIPDIVCTYYAREDFQSLAKNNFENGKWNILTAYYTKTLRSLSIRHFIPLFFVLSLLLPLLCCYQLSIAILIIYLSVVTLRSLQIKKNTSLWYQIIAFFVLHVSYGIGEISGIIHLLKNLRRK